MPGRTFSADSEYRYGFNGKENDNEVKGKGNQQDYGFRIYDPRLGKFLSTDPLTKSYPELTSYQFASNCPIAGIDLDGLELYYPNAGNAEYIANLVKPESEKRSHEEIKTIAKADIESKKTWVPVLIIGAIGFCNPGVGIPMALSYLTGLPFLPSPQAMSGSFLSRTLAETEIALEEASVIPVVKPPSPVPGRSLQQPTVKTVTQNTNNQSTASNSRNPSAATTNNAAQIADGTEALTNFKKDLPNVFKGIDKKHLDAAVGDMKGNPIVNNNGKVYDHLDDITGHMRGLNGKIKELNKLIDKNTFSGDALKEANQLRSSLQSQYDSYGQALQRAANSTGTQINIKKKG